MNSPLSRPRKRLPLLWPLDVALAPTGRGRVGVVDLFPSCWATRNSFARVLGHARTAAQAYVRQVLKMGESLPPEAPVFFERATSTGRRSSPHAP